MIDYSQATNHNFAWSFSFPKRFASTTWMSPDGVDAAELWMEVSVSLRYLHLPDGIADTNELGVIPEDWFEDIVSGVIWTPAAQGSKNADIAEFSDDLIAVLQEVKKANPDTAKYLRKNLVDVINTVRSCMPASSIQQIEEKINEAL